MDVDALWRASDLVDEYIGDQPVTPLTPRISVRAAQHRLPAGLVAALDTHLRANAAEDRLDDVLDELQRIRHEAGSPPLAAPIGQVLASQALLHVLSAERYGTVVDEFRALMEGRFGTPPGPFDRHVQRAVALTADDEPDEELDWDKLREEAAGLASSEEELILLALFGEEAEPLLHNIRAPRDRRGRRSSAAPSTRQRAEQIRDLVRVVQESGRGRDHRRGGRHARHGAAHRGPPAADRRPPPQFAAAEPRRAGRRPPRPPRPNGFVRVESPMVGTFYRAPEPGRGAVRRGGRRRRARPDALHPRGDEAHEPREGRRRRAPCGGSRSATASRSSTASCSSSSSLRRSPRRSTRLGLRSPPERALRTLVSAMRSPRYGWIHDSPAS